MQLIFENLDNGIGCVRLAGVLDIPGVNEIELKFTVYTATLRKPVIIDLSEVTMITSMGVGMLVAAARTLKSHNRALVLLNPQRRVKEVLTMAAIEQILPIEHDLDAALQRAAVSLDSSSLG